MKITSIRNWDEEATTINRSDLAKRWGVSRTCVDNNIKNNKIRCISGNVSMFEVKRHEDKLEAIPSLPYTAFCKYMSNHIESTNVSPVSDYLTSQTQFMSSWVAGKSRIEKRFVIKVLEHFIGVDEEAMYNYLVENL